MNLPPEDLILFSSKTRYYSTEKLYELEYYLRNNNKFPIYNHMYEIVKMYLIERGEKSLLNHRNKQINYLDKCFSLSNPFGRLSARLIGYIGKFIDKGKITKRF